MISVSERDRQYSIKCSSPSATKRTPDNSQGSTKPPPQAIMSVAIGDTIPKANSLQNISTGNMIRKIDPNNIIRLPYKFCIVCGSYDQTGVYPFTYNKGSSVASAAKLVGDISIVAEYLTTKPYKIDASFCSYCHVKFLTLERTSQLFHLAFAVVILLTILGAMYVGSVSDISTSLLTLGIGVCIAIAVNIYAKYYMWKNTPNITKLNKKKLVLKVPGHGKLTYDLEELQPDNPSLVQ